MLFRFYLFALIYNNALCLKNANRFNLVYFKNIAHTKRPVPSLFDIDKKTNQR